MLHKFLTILVISAMLLFGNASLVAQEISYGPVQKGETLSAIARQIAKSNGIAYADTPQLLVLLLGNNPQAFSDSCNMNTLQRDVMLELVYSTPLRKLNVALAEKFVSDSYQLDRNSDRTAMCSQLQQLMELYQQQSTSESAGSATVKTEEPSLETKPATTVEQQQENISLPSQPVQAEIPEDEKPQQQDTQQQVAATDTSPLVVTDNTTVTDKPEVTDVVVSPPPPEPVEQLPSSQQENPFADLAWMEVDTLLGEYWQAATHAHNNKWLHIWPKTSAEKSTKYTVLTVVSKKSNSYSLALEKLLEVFQQRKMDAAFTVVNIDKDEKVLQTALQYAEQNGMDLVFSMGSESESYLHETYQYGQIAVVTSTNKDPVLLGQVESYDAIRQNNIAYTSLNVPMAIQMQYLKILKPEIKNIAIMYNQNHTQVVETEVKPLKQELLQQSIDVFDVTVTSSDAAPKMLAQRIPQVVAEMRQSDPELKNSIFWITSSTAIFTHIDTINQYCGTVPVLAGIPNAVTDGANSAVIAFGIDRRSNAHLAALYAIDVLQGNKKPGELPVGVVTPPDISVNFMVAKKIGLKIPFRFLENANFIYDYNGKIVRDFGKNVAHN